MDQQERELHAQVREHLHQLEQARHSGDQRSEARLQVALAEAWEQLRCPGKSIWFWQERLRVVEALGDLVEVVFTFAQLGNAYGAPTGDRAKCFAYWHLAELFGDERMRQIMAECFAHARRVLGEQRFTRAWRKSERPFRWLQFLWRAEALPLLHARCQLMGEPSRYPYFWSAREEVAPHGDAAWQDAIQQGQRDLHLVRGQKNRAQEALLLANLGCALDHLGQGENSLRSYEEALALFQQMGDAGGELEALCNLAVVEVNCRRLFDDLFLYYHAVASHRAGERGDGRHLTLLSWQRGRACRQDEFFNDALFWLDGALQGAQALGDKTWRDGLSRELIWTRMEMGHYQKALELGQQALACEREGEGSGGKAHLLFLLALLYGATGSFVEAERACHEAIALFQDAGDSGMAGRTFVHLGILFLWQGKRAQGDAHLQRGIALLPQGQVFAVRYVEVLAERLAVTAADSQKDRA